MSVSFIHIENVHVNLCIEKVLNIKYKIVQINCIAMDSENIFYGIAVCQKKWEERDTEK